jgi:hypothetical protein
MNEERAKIWDEFQCPGSPSTDCSSALVGSGGDFRGRHAMLDNPNVIRTDSDRAFFMLVAPNRTGNNCVSPGVMIK